jgi:hypothetical protein
MRGNKLSCIILILLVILNLTIINILRVSITKENKVIRNNLTIQDQTVVRSIADYGMILALGMIKIKLHSNSFKSRDKLI